jgi:dTDP-4-amino-4,6-dideoxygalactose transaminase
MSDLAIFGGSKVRNTPFSPWPQYLPTDIDRVVRQLESRHWGGFPLPGKVSGQFAADFAAMHNARYGLCLANGTVALVVAMQAAGIGFGDEVIVPAYTWDGTATAVLQIGAIPIFADIDPDTYCLSVESVRSLITPKTRAILPVHLAMRFADMDGLRALASQHGLLIIEDCAHAHGGAYKGEGAGSMGDAGCFSMQESKLMTSGEGGICLTNRLDIYEAMQTIVNCGRASLTDEFGLKRLGCNYRLTEIQACLLAGQLEMLPDFRARRVRNADLLTRLLSEIDGIRPLPPQPEITAETLYCYVFQYRPGPGPAPHRDLFVAALEKEGIPCDGRFYESVYSSDLFYADPRNCPQLSVGRESPVDYASVKCEVSERAAYHEAVWLPQFLLIGDEKDVRDVAEAVSKVMSARERLAAADPGLAGVKAMGRAQRARVERQKNY